MKCQIRGCDEEGTHCAMYGKEVMGIFCREHWFRMITANWGCKIEKIPEATGTKKLEDFFNE